VQASKLGEGERPWATSGSPSGIRENVNGIATDVKHNREKVPNFCDKPMVGVPFLSLAAVWLGRAHPRRQETCATVALAILVRLRKTGTLLIDFGQIAPTPRRP
jgi:hypothetical protein